MSEVNHIGKTGEQTSFEPIVRQNENEIVNTLTIDATNNAVSAGHITIETTATVTVNGYWSIV